MSLSTHRPFEDTRVRTLWYHKGSVCLRIRGWLPDERFEALVWAALHGDRLRSLHLCFVSVFVGYSNVFGGVLRGVYPKERGVCRPIEKRGRGGDVPGVRDRLGA